MSDFLALTDAWSDVTTITRDELVEICETMISRAAEYTGIDPDGQAAEDLRAVAREATMVTPVTWWSPGHECGCLVGTLLRDVPNATQSRYEQDLADIGEIMPSSCHLVLGRERGQHQRMIVVD